MKLTLFTCTKGLVYQVNFGAKILPKNKDLQAANSLGKYHESIIFKHGLRWQVVLLQANQKPNLIILID